MKEILWRLLALCLGVLMLAGCGQESASPSAATIPVKVGMLRLASSAPLFIGIEKGYFAEEGITPEPVWFDAAQPIAVATASNAIDVGATGLTAGLYNLAAAGQVPYLVADKGREVPEHSGSFLVVTPQAYEAGVHDVKDLAGKTLGNTQAGSTYQYMAGHLLEQAGLDRTAVNYANLGKVSAVLAALTSGQIDGAIVNEPFASQLLESGQVKLLTPVGERLTYQTSAVFYAPRFAQNNDAGKRFMRAYIRACRDYYDAVFADAPAMTPAKRLETDARFREVVEIISRYTQTPTTDVSRSLPYIDRDGKLATDDIAKQIAWYRVNGFMEHDLAAEACIRTQSWQAAYDSLK